MPYFVRKSWHETQASVSEPAANLPMSESNAVEIARSVLAHETEDHWQSDGPFRCRTPVCAGETAKIVLSVEANGSHRALSVAMSAGHLRARSGGIIPTGMVRLDPSDFLVEPGKSQSLEVKIMVPDEAEPGVYSGRVTGCGEEPINFLIEVEVIAAD